MADSPRNIVLCSDGTGSSGTDWQGSNVWKTFKGASRHDALEPRQLVFYDEGVGTSSFSVKKALGGAVGLGLGKNIRELYTSLAKNYRPGDKIFIFGFSRGAFTARSLAGMIADIGVVSRHGAGGRELSNEELDDLVEAAYKGYRSKSLRKGVAGLRQKCEVHDARIHFVGVWDTVDAIGVPFDELRAVVYWIARRFIRPHNFQLNDKTDNIYQALAIDEDRQTFSPDVLKEPSPEEQARRGLKIEQVWFSGAHTNVGGGYPRQGMSDVALDWMMCRAERCGLRFTPEARAATRRDMDVHGTLYDSRSGPSAIYRYLARNVGQLTADAGRIGSAAEPVVEQPKAKIHVTVMDRCGRATADYAPINLPADFEVVGTCDETCDQALQDEERAKVESYTQRLAREGSRDVRREAYTDAWRLVKWRKWLYRLFLVCTLAVAALGVAMMVNPEATIRWYRSWSVLHQIGLAWVRFWQGLGGSAPAWLGKVGGGLQAVILQLTPEALRNLVGGLLQLPEACVAIALLVYGLIRLKRRLLRKMKRLGLKTWHAALG